MGSELSAQVLCENNPNCTQGIDPDGNDQSCIVDCADCKFYFYCSWPECRVFMECPENAYRFIIMNWEDEGINSGGQQTQTGTYTSVNVPSPFPPYCESCMTFVWTPNIQQWVYISVEDEEGNVICEKKYYYNCY